MKNRKKRSIKNAYKYVWGNLNNTYTSKNIYLFKLYAVSA